MMTLITINRVYYLIGFVVMLLVVMTLRDRANPKRFTTALFWFLFGGIFLFGDLMVQELGKSLAYRIIGGGVIAIALLAGFSLVGIGYYKMSTEEARVCLFEYTQELTVPACADDPDGDGYRHPVPERGVDRRRVPARSKTAHPGGAFRCLRCGDPHRLVAYQSRCMLFVSLVVLSILSAGR
jgi:hypothetical protein